MSAECCLMFALRCHYQFAFLLPVATGGILCTSFTRNNEHYSFRSCLRSYLLTLPSTTFITMIILAQYWRHGNLSTAEDQGGPLKSLARVRSVYQIRRHIMHHQSSSMTFRALTFHARVSRYFSVIFDSRFSAFSPTSQSDPSIFWISEQVLIFSLRETHDVLMEIGIIEHTVQCYYAEAQPRCTTRLASQ
ncbi:hypothetical protein BDZ97DRAFT_850873 [Flammula alnicola]|nr:hypothetical protein BDZ97DRAFT_850873 [Flammula alnicola]